MKKKLANRIDDLSLSIYKLMHQISNVENELYSFTMEASALESVMEIMDQNMIDIFQTNKEFLEGSYRDLIDEYNVLLELNRKELYAVRNELDELYYEDYLKRVKESIET